MRLIAAMVLIFSIPGYLGASPNLRCGATVVSVGDSTAQVLLKCGEPLTRENVAVKTAGFTEKLVQVWTYALGHGRFLKLLTFEAGRLTAIENGERQ